MTSEACPHPDNQVVRTVYYLMCGACKQIRLVSYCNYSEDCHPKCTLAPVCVQPVRAKYHAAVPLEVPPELVVRPSLTTLSESRSAEAARPRPPAAASADSR